MNPRQERGLVIAATQKLTQKGRVWIVGSQTGSGKKYTVCPDADSPYCSCPDHEDTGGMCKHLYAVGFTMSRDTAADGTVTETRSVTFTQKKTYTQDWPMYNLAQTEEKRRLLALLHDLCRGLADPPQNTTGRRRTAMADMIFTAGLKVYTGLSSRRFGSDVADAFDNGYLTHKLHPGMVCTFLESPLLTPVLKQLIAVTALPLRAVETEFAVDSTGFSASRFVRWFDEKYGVERSGKTWVKCHLAVGVKTHVVTAVEVLDRDAADCPQFKPLVSATAKSFTVKEVSADKAYLSVENIEAVFAHGGTPFIAFKENSTGAAGGLFEKMYHYYALNKEAYMAHYHKRSNVESANSMIKAKFGDSVRSKTDVAMVNEALTKIVCHNLCCLILSQCELGIEPVFWGEQAPVVVETVPAVAPVAVVETLVLTPETPAVRSGRMLYAGA
jgi:transposase